MLGMVHQFKIQPLNSFKRMSTKATQRGKMLDVQIFDPYIPPANIFTFNNFMERSKKFFMATAGVAILKWKVKGWSPKSFALASQQKYISMNERFSKGDLDGLKELVTDGMFSKLNPEIKKAKAIGEYEWKYHGDTHRPRLIHVSQAKLPMPEGEVTIVQATVEIQIKQSVAIYRNGKVVGGDPSKILDPKEYVVFEKFIDSTDDWKIKGKINQ
ncbi:39S ribosomal protein L45, mitochondrial [Terramyces sp. JEL0728]|nr:39S ribosomal protein L45, mitochondrial [Terramyces sp. JEL0728]